MKWLKQLLPSAFLSQIRPAYHRFWPQLGALLYRHPSRQLTVIGVTGTKGKSSTVEILADIWRAAGHKVAQSGTIGFKIVDKEIPNLYKMSMPGRLFMQRFLRQAVNANCDVAIVELTSEGAKQFRHHQIELDALVVTNIAPEHIESHGSYENYKAAKRSLAESIENNDKPDSKLILNGNNQTVLETFAGIGADTVLTPTWHKDHHPIFRADDKGIVIEIDNQTTIKSSLRGDFNAENILLAVTTAQAFKIDTHAIKSGVANVTNIKGRVEFVNVGQDFDVVVDYAHTPDSLQALYDTFSGQRRICVLGNTGGGRDTWKRPQMGQIANDCCDKIILTNEDPYDEDPQKIIDEMTVSIDQNKLEVIMDRRQAITTALKHATSGDAVLISGKGTDPYIMGPNGTKELWNDKQVATEELEKMS